MSRTLERMESKRRAGYHPFWSSYLHLLFFALCLLRNCPLSHFLGAMGNGSRQRGRERRRM